MVVRAPPYHAIQAAATTTPKKKERSIYMRNTHGLLIAETTIFVLGEINGAILAS